MLREVRDGIAAACSRLLIRPAVAAAFCFIAGCLAAYPFEGLPPGCLRVFFGLIICFFVIINLFSVFILKRKSVITVSGNIIPLLLKKFEINKKISEILKTACFLLLPVFFVCGNLRMSNVLSESEYEHWLSYDMNSKAEDICLEGIIEKTERTQYSLKVSVKDAVVSVQDRELAAGKVIVYVPFGYESELECTDFLRVFGNAKAFDSASNEGEFDEKSYYRAKGYSSFFETEELLEIRKYDALGSRFKKMLQDFKKVASERIGELLSEDKAGVVAAVLLGERSELKSDIKELYNKAGVGHLLSISGLHISLVGMLVMGLMKKMRAGRLIRGFAAVLIIFCYCCMTGFGLSTKRAFVMLCVMLAAEIFWRRYDIFSGLALAAIIILYMEPLELFEASFLLSFSATFGIAVFVNESRIWKELIKSKFLTKTLEICGAGIFVQLSTLPVMLWAFSEICLFSFFINLLVIPLFTYVVVFSTAAVAVSCIWRAAGSFLCGFVYYVLELYELLCGAALEVPLSRWCPGKPETFNIILYYMVLCLLIYGARRCVEGKKRKSFAGLILALFFLPVLLVPLKGNRLEVHFLDVGQGDCIFFRYKDSTYLVDCGSTSEKNIEDNVIIPFLKAKGVKKLDYLFLTHADADHVNGADGIISSDIEVKSIILPYVRGASEEFEEIIGIAAENKISVYYISEGNSIKKDELFIRCLHPEENYAADNKNDGSAVLLVSFKDFDMLLTGDIGSEAEKEICGLELWKEEQFQAEVLKCAHHGSKYSSSEEFLSLLRPMIAVISCSADNSYGHPHSEVLERLETARIYITKDSGQISVITDGNKIRVYNFIP